MRGMAELVDLRLRGFQPTFGVVWELSATPWLLPAPADRTAYLYAPHGRRDDLRGLVGLRVLVIGKKREEVLGACEAALAAGGAVVVGIVSGEDRKLDPANVVFARNSNGDIEDFTWQQ